MLRWLRRRRARAAAILSTTEQEDFDMAERGINTRLATLEQDVAALQTSVETVVSAANVAGATVPPEALEEIQRRLGRFAEFANLFRFSKDEVQFRTKSGWVALEIVDVDGDGDLDVNLKAVPLE